MDLDILLLRILVSFFQLQMRSFWILKNVYIINLICFYFYFFINHYLHNESSRFGSPEERLFAMFRGDGCYGLGRCTRISRSDIG